MSIKQIKKEIFRSLQSAYPNLKKMPYLMVPPDSSLGDLGLGCFNLAKDLKEQPEKIAKTLADKIKPSSLIEKSKNFGPYLNFFLKREVWFKAIFQDILFPKASQYEDKEIKDKTILIEFSSPNTNKPQHLGHFRNNSLGVAISNLLEEKGANVIRTNLINDRGIHIMKAMLAWQKWGDDKTPQSEKKKPDHFVGDYYVLFEKKSKEIPGLIDEAHNLLKKWEEGDPQTIELWQKINNWALEGLFQTYKKTDVLFDKIYYESEIYQSGKSIVKKALRKGIVQRRKDKAIEIDLSELGKKVLLRADGTSVYITQDIGLAYLRWKEYHPSQMIYVIASEQEHYLKSLFKTLELFGFPAAKKCYHLSYGMVSLPEGRMKSREGKVVDADSLIWQMEDLAKKEIKARYPDISSKELTLRAEKIAQAAIKFYLLYFKPSKDISYKPEESIAFEGATGPYLLYTFARAKNILKKSNREFQPAYLEKVNLSLLNKKEEVEIMKLLFFWPDTLEKAVYDYNPGYLAQMLIKLAQSFNEFYQTHKVIGVDQELENVRLLLVKSVAQTLNQGLNLLGIKTLDQM